MDSIRYDKGVESMNIFIGEDNFQDYLYLKKVIDKWSKSRNITVHIYYFDKLFYQLPKVIQICQLAFLDVHMSVINGFEFAKLLRKYDQKIDIVFQSKSRDYSVESYKIKALDYLLKPVNEKDVWRLLDVVLLRNQEKYFVYKQKKALKKIRFVDILYVRVYKHYCFIRSIDTCEKAYLTLDSMKKILDQRFVQCYRSYIVNIDYIKVIENEEIVLFNNEKIPLSKTYTPKLKEIFMKQI